MSHDHARKTYGPPGNEDPIEVTTDIRWSSPTETVSIPQVYVYSTGVYFPVIYRTVVDTPPPPLPENTPDERRATARAQDERLSPRLRVERLKVNGAGAEVPSVKSRERGFNAWAWSDSRTHQAGRPENAMRFQLDWPGFPGAEATVPYPPPGSPTGPLRGAPAFWHDERGSGHTVLRNPNADPAITGESPEEQA
jgi:hypothetical protein